MRIGTRPKGHTIEVKFHGGSSVTLDGKEYGLKQLHFHTPSEHQIDGITYPMEGHVVNIIEPESLEDPPQYLVVSFVFRMGDEDPFIESFLNDVSACKRCTVARSTTEATCQFDILRSGRRVGGVSRRANRYS